MAKFRRYRCAKCKRRYAILFYRTGALKGAFAVINGRFDFICSSCAQSAQEEIERAARSLAAMRAAAEAACNVAAGYAIHSGGEDDG